MHSLLPKEPGHKFVLGFQERLGVRSPEPLKVTSRQGQVSSTTIRSVCAKCNNGWMNTVEEAARPNLTSLITGKRNLLTPEAQQLVARRVALKVLVSEHDHPVTAVTRSDERVAFMKSRQFPDGMKIWIGKCGAESWQSAYYRYSARIPDPPGLESPPGNNVQAIAFGMGDLFIYVFQNRSKVPMDTEVFGQGFVVQVLPAGEECPWPPPNAISADDANALAYALPDKFNVAVGWRPARSR